MASRLRQTATTDVELETIELTDIERWFLARGIPHFIADYDRSTRLWTRALPFLLVTYLLAAIPVGADSWRDAGVELTISMACLVVVWVATSVVRRRPILGRPKQVGALELGVYVVGPVLGHLLAGEVATAAVAAAIQVLLLGLAYVATSYALIPLLRWTTKRSVDSLRAVGPAAARALPVLLLFVTFFFMTAEVWQVFGRLRGLPFGLALLLFLLSGSAFAANRARADLRAIDGELDDPEELHEALVGTPAEHLAGTVDAVPDATAGLSLRQRINLIIVIVINQILLSLMVALAIGGFFLIFGFLVMGRDVVEAWVLHPPNALWTLRLSGRTLVLSEELVRVTAFLATFSGFYFGVYSTTDAALREDLGEFAEDNLRQLFAVRHAYLASR